MGIAVPVQWTREDVSVPTTFRVLCQIYFLHTVNARRTRYRPTAVCSSAGHRGAGAHRRGRRRRGRGGGTAGAPDSAPREGGRQGGGLRGACGPCGPCGVCKRGPCCRRDCACKLFAREALVRPGRAFAVRARERRCKRGQKPKRLCRRRHQTPVVWSSRTAVWETCANSAWRLAAVARVMQRCPSAWIVGSIGTKRTYRAPGGHTSSKTCNTVCKTCKPSETYKMSRPSGELSWPAAATPFRGAGLRPVTPPPSSSAPSAS